MKTVILGVAQGIFEWLPISSSAVLLIIQENFFQNTASLEETLELILFLHMGTFFSALIYFHKEIGEILKNLFSIKQIVSPIKNRILFLFISTLISGLLGIALLGLIKLFEKSELISFSLLNTIVGVLLIITGLIQFYKPYTQEIRTAEHLKVKDGIILGLLQGLAALPGISRSGITIAGLLMRKIDKEEALRLSFIMGLPITLAGNIVLNLDKFSFSNEYMWGLISAFLVGLVTIHLLIKLAKRFNLGYIALFFGILLAVSGFISF